eukprot:TRINITY_DN2152_c0_g1_i1.p1 TRINITY_DN2152_c0_g1~~TRINITY_DN2152_c0_g1_i1.p1  ORF type:complete len:865 (+),score=212.30 TRINITY_DN2152_c0_g1_i1:81-2675(+)
MSSDPAVIRIKPYYYIHVLDNNSNVTRIEAGPKTFTRQEHEKVIQAVKEMTLIPPRNYVVVGNPVLLDEEGRPVLDKKTGQVQLKQGDEEIRFNDYPLNPFPLYPGETLLCRVQPLTVVPTNTALKLKVIRDFTDEKSGKAYSAGDDLLFEGPGTYIPRVEVKVDGTIQAKIIGPNEALRIQAKKKFFDERFNVERNAGDEWLVKEVGSFIPSVDEEILKTVEAVILTTSKALHIRAIRTFTDAYKTKRKAGEEWLVTLDMAETHIPDVNEFIVGEVKLMTLTNRQYCFVLDPWKEGKQQLGQKELRVGERSFFLNPGEKLEGGIKDVKILSEQEALLLKARENFYDEIEKKERNAGDLWMVYGPCEYFPPIQVAVEAQRKAIPLDDNEGIYVRDIKTGEVRAVTGQTYMLKPNEELWKKELPRNVEDLLAKENQETERDKTRVVTFRAPHNTAVQIYDYKEKQPRVVFGPELVMLGPDEHFTVLSLSGDKPKRPNVIKALSLQLGPDFMTDIVIVETGDHARLSLKLSYNWHFELNKNSPEEAAKLFQVPDFTGDACKAIASRVRGAVAGVSFDFFHKNSAKIIRAAVFGEDENKKIRNKFSFSANNLVITNIDIQSVEPVDSRTRDALQKSVQMAIEITTKAQEANARHNSTLLEQEAMSKLERQKILDDAEAEKSRKLLLELQNQTAEVEAIGTATAEAKGKAEAKEIEGKAAVRMAELTSQAKNIKNNQELEILQKNQEAEIKFMRQKIELNIQQSRDLAAIETKKFKEIVEAIGPQVIENIAKAGPEMQAKLLSGLGLQGFLITDGNSPINLFNTASGLISQTTAKATGGQNLNTKIDTSMDTNVDVNNNTTAFNPKEE